MESPVTLHSDTRRQAGLPPSPLAVGRAFGLGMVLLLFVGYLTYCVINYGLVRFEDADAKRVKEREKILADRLADDGKWLHDAPSWFNKDKGLVRVPIERAMAMTAAELSKVAPHAGDPIAANPPQPAAAPSSPANPEAAQSPAPAPSPTPASAPAAPTLAVGAPVPLPGATPAAPAAPAPAPNAAPAPLATPPPAPSPVPAGSTPAPSPTDPGVKPGAQ